MLVITGNPGVGKHTLARRLATRLKMEILDVNQIAIQHKTYRKGVGALDVDTAKVARIIEKMRPKNAILVGHLAPYVVSKTQVKFALILRKNPYKLIPIYKKRKYTDSKAAENAASEILGVIAYDAIKKFGAKKSLQLDTTGLTISQTTKKAEQILKRRKGDKVDWLQMVAKKGDLGRFFVQ